LPYHQAKKRPRKKDGGNSGGEQMDVNLTGHVWGMPFDLIGQLNATMGGESNAITGTLWDSPTTIVAMIASLAFVLSCYNAYVDWKNKQPSITVQIREYVDSIHSLTHDPERVISIRGYNNGQIPLNITQYMLFLPSNQFGFSLGKPYTTRVLPGAHCERWEFSDKIARHLKDNPSNLSGTVKMIAGLMDDGERWYKSKEFEFDIDQALKGTKGKREWTPQELGWLPKGFRQKLRYRIELWKNRKYLPPH
jgi:hypothetical protein